MQNVYRFMTVFDCLEVTLSGWEDVKIQLLTNSELTSRTAVSKVEKQYGECQAGGVVFVFVCFVVVGFFCCCSFLSFFWGGCGRGRCVFFVCLFVLLLLLLFSFFCFVVYLQGFHKEAKYSSIIIYSLTARVIGALQMIPHLVSSISSCSPLPSGTWQTPGLSIPWCCLPTSFSVCLVFFPLSLCLARWFWPDLMNGRHDQKKYSTTKFKSGRAGSRVKMWKTATHKIIVAQMHNTILPLTHSQWPLAQNLKHKLFSTRVIQKDRTLDLWYTNVQDAYTLHPSSVSDDLLITWYSLSPNCRGYRLLLAPRQNAVCRGSLDCIDCDVFINSASDFNELTESVCAYVEFCVQCAISRKTVRMIRSSKPCMTGQIESVINKTKTAFQKIC